MQQVTSGVNCTSYILTAYIIFNKAQVFTVPKVSHFCIYRKGKMNYLSIGLKILTNGHVHLVSKFFSSRNGVESRSYEPGSTVAHVQERDIG